MLNAPVQASVNPECLINQNNNYFQRRSRKDQPWRRLATVNKIAQKAGYNLTNYFEKRTIAELLNLYGEYSYLTGKHLGTYYLSTLDLDLRNEKFVKELIKRLEKNTDCLLNSLHVSYDKTKRGLHIDILTPEPLENQQIYYRGWGKVWNVGSIQSKGKYVVGEDACKFFIKNGKWYWKVKNNEELKKQLAKFFFELGNQEKSNSKEIELLSQETLKITKYQAWDYNLNQAVIREYSLIVEKPLKKPAPQSSYLAKKYNIQAKILSKEKTNLEHMWKVFCLDMKTKQKRYFLVNDYQKSYVLPNLEIGSIRNIMLINGYKHQFFSRILNNHTIQYNTQIT